MYLLTLQLSEAAQISAVQHLIFWIAYMVFLLYKNADMPVFHLSFAHTVSMCTTTIGLHVFSPLINVKVEHKCPFLLLVSTD